MDRFNFFLLLFPISPTSVILEHEDKNVRTELICRVLIATIKTPIHISRSKFSFHVQRSLKHTIIYAYLSLLMWSII